RPAGLSRIASRRTCSGCCSRWGPSRRRLPRRPERAGQAWAAAGFLRPAAHAWPASLRAAYSGDTARRRRASETVRHLVVLALLGLLSLWLARLAGDALTAPPAQPTGWR